MKKDKYVKKVSADFTEEDVNCLAEMRAVFQNRNVKSNSECLSILLNTFGNLTKETRECLVEACLQSLEKIKKNDNGVAYWSKEHEENNRSILQLEKIISFITAAGDITLPAKK